MKIIRGPLLLIAAVLQVAIAFFPSSFGIDGNIGSTAVQNETPLSPAGFVFVIWLFLYSGSIFYAIWHLFARSTPARTRTAWLAFLAFASNAVWAYHQPTFGPDFVSVAILESILLFSFLAGLSSRADNDVGKLGRSAYIVLFGLAGWIMLASAPGVSIALSYEGVTPFGPDKLQESYIIIGSWSIIALIATSLARSFSFAVPIIWGLNGVALANSDNPVFVGVLGGVAALIITATWASKRRFDGK